jgi:hypothetical protein
MPDMEITEDPAASMAHHLTLMIQLDRLHTREATRGTLRESRLSPSSQNFHEQQHVTSLREWNANIRQQLVMLGPTLLGENIHVEGHIGWLGHSWALSV